MLDHVVPAIRATVVTLVLTGLLYPLVMTGVAKVLFPQRAEGSFVTDGSGKVVGSELVAQGFANPGYFQPRPSAAGEKGYDPLASAGSNLGPTSKKLRDRAAGALEKLQKENPDAPGPAPVELVTASGSGLDPHVSPAAALWQIPRVAKARGVAPERVRSLVEDSTEGRDLGILGEPRVNVLQLNLALDRRLGAPPPAPPAAPAQAPSATTDSKG
ncbi:MAG: potassium-transporting ATPase subunit C [Anaeromyxobacter sp. RBG_16_69_14]|nr:MAG: potassium-transporting ATPase subunit C [Anaeromyxobacter sp. RBG_16_69_14]